MKQRSIKTNFILTLIRVISATLVGVVMMPYVNKILGVENIGKIEYGTTIINYFLMLSAIGIPIYGIREIAKVRNDIYLRTKITVELLTILLITSILSYIILYIIIQKLGLFVNYSDIIIILSSMILLTNLGAEWYFQGMENQVYITVRYVLVRIITLVLLYLLVKNSDDYLVYCCLIVLNICGSNIFNAIYINKSLNLRLIKFDDLNFKKHLYPILTVFVAAISVNIYSQLDSFLLGYLAGDKYLGYYSVASKLIRYALTVITIIGAVSLPRLSTLWHENREEYYVKLKSAYDIILLVSIPFAGYFIVFSKNIIFLMAGDEFENAGITICILSPLCTIVGIAYYFGYLVLFPQGKEKIYTYSVIGSAVLSIFLNYFMIKYFKHNGAALTQVLVEIFAIIIMGLCVRKDLFKLKLIDYNLLKIVFGTLVVVILFEITSFTNHLEFIKFFFISGLYFCMIVVILTIIRENNIFAYLRILIKR
ncbi:flippase [Chryseobacterium sp. 18068]|uniref:flippase n=1 Tax=Chryseobacterium sp. 18068 TaxID=2681414 RepID=UPI001357680C|nr:flippase [Chryseobacterium sp. 18068]